MSVSGASCHISGVIVNSNSQAIRELKFWEKVHLLPPVTYLMSHVRSLSSFSFSGHSGEASQWRVYYQQGLPCLVYLYFTTRCIKGCSTKTVLIDTLTQGCLKMHDGVPSFYAFLLILYIQGSIAQSLENVWWPYYWILSNDPQAMIADLNVNKQRKSTTLGQHILQRLSI